MIQFDEYGITEFYNNDQGDGEAVGVTNELGLMFQSILHFFKIKKWKLFVLFCETKLSLGEYFKTDN